MILTFTTGMYLGKGAKLKKKKTTLAQLVGAINERLNAGFSVPSHLGRHICEQLFNGILW